MLDLSALGGPPVIVFFRTVFLIIYSFTRCHFYRPLFVFSSLLVRVVPFTKFFQIPFAQMVASNTLMKLLVSKTGVSLQQRLELSNFLSCYFFYFSKGETANF